MEDEIVDCGMSGHGYQTHVSNDWKVFVGGRMQQETSIQRNIDDQSAPIMSIA